MPELPEVETTRRGISPHLLGRIVTAVRVRERRLRWPIPEEIERQLPGRTIDRVGRRAKYLLIGAGEGTAIIHLGMSGSLRILSSGEPPTKHDHVDLTLDDGACLRFRDPRRFGSLLWTLGDPGEHRLLARLGPEPLEASFSGTYLYERSRKRRVAIKQFLMDSQTVVGVGNIYASESLHAARIHPTSEARLISRERYRLLARCVRETLEQAIDAGGTTLRDFSNSEGKPGYFAQQLAVYGREGQPCMSCEASIKRIVQCSRASFFCPGCQRQGC